MELIAGIAAFIVLMVFVYIGLDAARDKSKHSAAESVKRFAGVMSMSFAVALIIYIALAQVPKSIEPQVRQLIAGIAAFIVSMVFVYIGLDAARDKD